MSRTKAFISILMVLILIALSVASVWAAPNPDEEFISGVVEGIEIVTEVDQDTGETITTVLVTLALVDETTNEPTGETQTVSLSLATAIALGLVQVDENGEPVVDEDGNPIPNEDMIGQPVEIDPNDVIEEDEEGWHPVASALAEFFVEYLPEFFTDILDLDYETVMGYHEDGMGFGVIAQACWMSSMLYDSEAEDNITPGDILEAKKDHDFSSIELPDGTTAKNWGQFRKAVLGSEKAQKNLGAIMSGRAAGEQEQEEEEEEEDVVVGSSTELSGKGKDKGGKPDIPPGKVKDKKDEDKGGGPPAEPPGKVKNKDKGKGGGKKK